MKRSKHSGTILARDVLKTARLSLQSVHKSQNLMRPTDAHSVQPIAAQSWQLIMHAVVVGVQLQCSEPVLRWRCHRIMVRRMLWHTHTHTHTHARSTATCLERAFTFRLPPRTEDRSVPVVIQWCDLTMHCALSARLSLSADLSLCTGCYKLIFLTLHGGPAAAVR